MIQMNRLKALVLVLLATGVTFALAAEPPKEGDEGHENEEGTIPLTALEQTRDVEMAEVTRQALRDEVLAPGEVVSNAYRSAQVTPRITAQIVTRHAQLGDAVKPGQSLVTLSSVEMAQAQGELLVADREWQRVQKLGRDVVSEQRYVEAQVTRQQAYARVLAYGMTKPQVEALLKQANAAGATGEFELLAPRAGTVVWDGFVLGEVVEPGRVLFKITDESVLWVEARLPSEQAGRIALGTPARASRDGKAWFAGQVVQFQHEVQETTRTQTVRIEVENRDHALHPGQYVDVALSTGEGEPVVVVPGEAVVLFQGAPTVFVAQDQEIKPQPVQPGKTEGGWTEIITGLEPGETIAVKGAFLLKSLLLKSQMGEGHGH